MDGDNRSTKQQHDASSFSARFGMAGRAVPRSSRATPTDRFRQQSAGGGLPAARGDLTGLSQEAAATGRPRIQTYMDYGYTDTTSFQGDSLQGDEMQPYSPQQSLREPQRHPPQQQQQQFTPYESEMVYNLGQQGPAQSPYEVVPQYQSRQSAAIEALSSQFAVPQYFPAGEPTGTGLPAAVSPYLTSQLPPSAYNPPGPIGRSSAAQPFSANMADFTPVGTTGRLEQQQPPPPTQPVEQQQQQQQQQSSVVSESTNFDEAFAQFHRALREIFDHTRASRLVEAGRSLLEISEWLVTNARELGILRDDQLLYSDRLQLWNDFNICWLAVCQRQKEMTQEMMQTGRQPPNTSLLGTDVMENMGKDLIQLCDKMEQHGLVDYQMGIWEEEILCVLGQCLDLIESRPDILRAHAITTPAAATSRS